MPRTFFCIIFRLPLFPPINFFQTDNAMMQLPDELEMSESGRTIQSDWIIGILMMIVSMSCAIAYYLILSVNVTYFGLD